MQKFKHLAESSPLAWMHTVPMRMHECTHSHAEICLAEFVTFFVGLLRENICVSMSCRENRAK